MEILKRSKKFRGGDGNKVPVTGVPPPSFVPTPQLLIFNHPPCCLPFPQLIAFVEVSLSSKVFILSPDNGLRNDRCRLILLLLAPATHAAIADFQLTRAASLT